MRKLAFITVLLMVFSIPLQNMFLVGNIGTVTRTIGLVAAILAMLAILTSGRIRGIRGFHIVVGLFALWTSLSLLWSIDVNETITRVQTMIQLAAMVWLLWEFARTEAQQTKILQTYVLGAWLATATIPYPLFFQDISLRRYTTGYFNENLIGMLVAIGIPIAIYLASKHSHRFWYWVNMTYIPMAIFGVLLTGSRAVIGAVLLSSILAIWIYLRLGIKAKIATSIFGIIALYILSSNVPSLVQIRLSSLENQIATSALPFRLSIWESGIELLTETNPILGIGPGTYEAAVESYLGHSKPPHNTFIGTFVELGPIGLTLFMIIVAMVFRSALAMRSSERWLWLVLLGMWTLVATFHSAETHKHTWLLFALAFSIGTRATATDPGQSAPIASSDAVLPQKGDRIAPVGESG